MAIISTPHIILLFVYGLCVKTHLYISHLRNNHSGFSVCHLQPARSVQMGKGIGSKEYSICQIWYDSLIHFLCISLPRNVHNDRELWTSKTDIRYLISLSWGEFQSAHNLDINCLGESLTSSVLRHVARCSEWKSLIRNRFQRLKEHAENHCSQRPILNVLYLHQCTSYSDSHTDIISMKLI